MKLTKPLLFFLLIASLGTLQAQDIHYTLFNMSPLTLNPAQTGAFNGTVRVGGIYRSQWYSVSNANGYETPSFYADAPIIRGFRDQDWVGIGGAIYNDRAGTAKLRTNATRFSAAYHLGLGKKNNSVLTLGLMGGTVQRRFDVEPLNVGDEWDPNFGTFSLVSQDDIIANERTNSDFFDLSAGLMLRSQLDEESLLELGVSVGHLTQPEYLFDRGSFQPNTDSLELDNADKRPMLINAHAKYEWALTDKWSAAPTAMFQTTRGASEFSLQAWAGYLVNPEKEVKLNFGLGYRFGDAGHVLLGLDYKDLRVAASYDINFSDLNTATNYQGGFEIAAWYIIKIYKDPEVKPAILCPKF